MTAQGIFIVYGDDQRRIICYSNISSREQDKQPEPSEQKHNIVPDMH